MKFFIVNDIEIWAAQSDVELFSFLSAMAEKYLYDVDELNISEIINPENFYFKIDLVTLFDFTNDENIPICVGECFH